MNALYIGVAVWSSARSDPLVIGDDDRVAEDWIGLHLHGVPPGGQQPLELQQRTNVDYEVSVSFDGCCKAQSPPSLIGGQTMAGVHGTTVVNPLFVVYGCFNTL